MAGLSQPPVRDRQWLLSLLPVFPIVLLVLRLWYLSGQDLPTMLLLVQHVSPVGPVSALLITLLWVFPVVVLVIGALGALLRASAVEPLRSRLGRASARTPDWVVILAALIAMITWQLRFLPTLLMLVLMIVGLLARIRHGGAVWVILAVVLPAIVAVAEYAWLGGAGMAAIRAGEGVTATLLLLPPAATLALTGPIPASAARPVTARIALVAGLLAPFVVGALFLRTPVLPSIALEVLPDRGGTDGGGTDGGGTNGTGTDGRGAGAGGGAEVIRGFVIDVDDTATTVLDERGLVRFVPNGQVWSKTLCPSRREVPTSDVAVHGWRVEQTMLEWAAPSRPIGGEDARCRGRPLP